MAPRIFQANIAGRELFVCDDLVTGEAIAAIAQYLDTLHYARREASRPGVPAGAASADLQASHLSEPFVQHLLATVAQLFAGERLAAHRAYVNNAVYGDTYYTHRDCPVTDTDVTILYYANRAWQADWGGETIYFDDNEDARLAVTPKPGRAVIARGAILHRGGVPTRACNVERRTIAYKLMQSPVR